MERKIRIGVIGASDATGELYKLAEEVGREIARRGAILITGGLGGVMEASSKGAKEAGGTTIGILPTKDPSDANEYIDIAIVTGISDARNVINVLSSDAIIAVGGGSGTLSEIAFALKFKKPIIGLNTWELKSAGGEEKAMIITSDPKEAVELAIKAIGGGKRYYEEK